MRDKHHYLLLFTLILLFALPIASAKASTGLPGYSFSAVPDSVITKKPAGKNGDEGKPEIKEVPKSKRQAKPAALGPKIKVKPPVKVKPNIIKRPPGIIKKSLRILG